MRKSKVVRNIVIGEGMPKICAPLTGETEEELLGECKLIVESEADLVEWRVDFFEGALQTEAVLATLPKLRDVLGDMPLLFSFRTAGEGGEKEIVTEQYVALNKEVASTGYVDLIDIELFQGEDAVKNVIATANAHQVLTVVSNHDFDKTPDLPELIRRVDEASRYGADLPKLAVMPKNEEDVLVLLKTSLQLKRANPNQPMIMIAMGGSGTISRLSGEIFGSSITFGSVKNTSAPGQVTVGQLKAILEVLHHSK